MRGVVGGVGAGVEGGGRVRGVRMDVCDEVV